MPGPNDLQNMYVGDDEDLSSAYASASNAPIMRAEPQATPQAFVATRADAANGPKAIRNYTPTDLRQLGEDNRKSNPLYDFWWKNPGAGDTSGMQTAVRMKGKRERENQEILDRGGLGRGGQAQQKIARNQPLPNVPISQLQPGHYSLQGIPNAEMLIKRGAKGLLVRPGGQIIILGLDGQNVDLKALASGGQGGPEGMPQPPGQRVVLPLRGAQQQ